jgi:hypothetical protein
MNKEFIPYELQKELYELGFNDKTTGVIVYKKEGVNEFSFVSEDFPTEWMSGVLYQQAFRWFRENGFICQIIYDNFYNSYGYQIDGKYHTLNENFISYNDAELACLKKLIEIVKNK